MTRSSFAACVRLVLCTLVTLGLFIPAAYAQGALGRTLDGQLIAMPTADEQLVVVFWSLDCTTCLTQMHDLAAENIPFIAVNTDAASERSALAPFAYAHRLTAPIVPDPEGHIQRRFAGTPDTVIAVSASGAQPWTAEDRRTARKP